MQPHLEAIEAIMDKIEVAADELKDLGRLCKQYEDEDIDYGLSYVVFTAHNDLKRIRGELEDILKYVRTESSTSDQ